MSAAVMLPKELTAGVGSVGRFKKAPNGDWYQCYVSVVFLNAYISRQPTSNPSHEDFKKFFTTNY